LEELFGEVVRLLFYKFLVDDFLERELGRWKPRMWYKDYANVSGIVESWLRGGMILRRCRKLCSRLQSRNPDRGMRSDRELWVRTEENRGLPQGKSRRRVRVTMTSGLRCRDKKAGRELAGWDRVYPEWKI
jgi:hypothetical protein